MANPNELRRARQRVEEAQRSLDGILALPRRRGAEVTWSNGVVWTRQGDDEWLPWSETEPADMPKLLYSSAHVASGTIVRTRTSDPSTKENEQ